MEFAGNRVKEVRESLGYSQEKLGNLIGVSKVAIWGYENGTKKPRIDKFINLVNILDKTPDYLLNRDIDVVCEETVPYSFKLSKKEMKLIKALRENKKLFNEICKELDIK